MGVRLALSMVLLSLALPAAAAARSVPQGFYGVVYDGAVTKASPIVQDAQFAKMARAGVESVRTVFSWAAAQRMMDVSLIWNQKLTPQFVNQNFSYLRADPHHHEQMGKEYRTFSVIRESLSKLLSWAIGVTLLAGIGLKWKERSR